MLGVLSMLNNSTPRIKKLLDHIEREIKEIKELRNEENKEFDDIFFNSGMTEAIHKIWIEIENKERKLKGKNL